MLFEEDIQRIRIVKAQLKGGQYKYYVVKFDFEEATWKCALYCHPDYGFKSLEEAFDMIVMIELHISYIDGGVVI